MPKVQEMPGGQKFILLPRALCLGLDWKKGTPVKIKILGKGKIEVSYDA